MITGVVTSFHQATIRLIVRGPTGQAQEIEAVIDTGFDGALSLPPADIAALGLPWRRRGRALGGCSTSLFDIYEARHGAHAALPWTCGIDPCRDAPTRRL
jgi:predicted aspartyl protease